MTDPEHLEEIARNLNLRAYGTKPRVRAIMLGKIASDLFGLAYQLRRMDQDESVRTEGR
jgi:hypothetical protein